jgi:hypothetical protein
MASGLTTLDPRTAATSKFVEEKIQKGELQPDQVVNFLLQMGADPKLASLVFKYQKVEQAAKNQGQGQPSTTTVDQDTSNQYAQLKQQERMRQGLGGMSVPAIANAAMQGGITGEPVRQMAGGGIVAFDEGGSIPRNRSIVPYKAPFYKRAAGAALGLAKRHPLGLGLASLLGLGLMGDEEEQAAAEEAQVEQAPEGMSEEDIRLLAAADAERSAMTPVAGAGTGMPARPKFNRPETPQMLAAIADAEKRVPKDRQAAFTEEMAREEELGETKAIEARRKELAGQKEKATTSPEKKFWLSFAQAGFAASSKGARNLWETLSMGGVEGLKAYETMKEKEAQTLEKIADKELQLNSMSAAIKRGAMDRGDKRYDDAVKDLRTLRLQHENQQVLIADAKNRFDLDIYKTDAQVAAADRRASAVLAGRKGKDTLVQQYYADVAASQRTTDPKMKAALKRRIDETIKAISDLEQTESGYQSQAARLSMQRGMLGLDDGFGGAEQVE